MGVDLHVVFAATLTAEEVFALPARLNSAPAVEAACRAYREQRFPRASGVERERWRWDDLWPAITTPTSILEAWASPTQGCPPLHGPPGLLWLEPHQLRLSPLATLSGFAADYEGCQSPIRRVCWAIARELGVDRVLYLPDSGDWPPEVGDLGDTPFDEARARLAAWAPPVSAIGALGYGRAVRNGYHYADGALRRPDGTALSEAEIMPCRSWITSGGVATYHDGTLVPPEELARTDLRAGFAYYVDDFRDLE
ncbi:MAG TPA: hypothetical protein VLM79_27440 [Kofleriaceae bacterium]|nr:hypothetical protein [Kofleriaceae bacterium]